jgi:hypothetical protein
MSMRVNRELAQEEAHLSTLKTEIEENFSRQKSRWIKTSPRRRATTRRHRSAIGKLEMLIQTIGTLRLKKPD